MKFPEDSIKDEETMGAEDNMIIQAIVEADFAEEQENKLAPAVNRRNKPTKKRANGNVVRRRKHSTPIFSNVQPQHEVFRDQARRSSSLKYYTTGYFNSDVKLSPYVPNQSKNERRSSSTQKPKKGLRRTLSMPSFQKQIKGKFR